VEAAAALQRQLGKIAGLIAREDPWCRGILLLGLDAPSDRLRAGFAEAAGHPIIKGFAVGRTIFGQPSRRWMAGELSDEALIGEVKRNYLTLIDYWREARG
jgi:5-dehydro-2-deoxygluconokinase